MRIDLCQAPMCTDMAYQEIAVPGTGLNKLVCTDEVHVLWAKDELTLDAAPGARFTSDLLMQLSPDHKSW